MHYQGDKYDSNMELGTQKKKEIFNKETYLDLLSGADPLYSDRTGTINE